MDPKVLMIGGVILIPFINGCALSNKDNAKVCNKCNTVFSFDNRESSHAMIIFHANRFHANRNEENFKEDIYRALTHGLLAAHA